MDELGELPSDAAMKKKETVLHDSMVTVRLSEPEPEFGGSTASQTASTETGEGLEVNPEGQSDKDESDEEEGDKGESKTTATKHIVGNVIPEEDESDNTDTDTVYETEIARMEVPGGKDKVVRRGSDRSDSETESVNWEVLERTEEQEPRDQDTEDVSSPFALE